MELLLNLTWLSVALVCAIGLFCRAKREPNAANIWLFITAAVCIVVLLFPVISMTDDLHAEVFTAEESGKHRVVVVHTHQLLSPNTFIARLAALVFVPARVTWSRSTEVQLPQPIEGIRLSSFTRPPPHLTLA